MSSGIFNRYTGYHNRRSIRLRGYDYSRPGYYFVTICTHDRKQQMFWDPVSGAGSKPVPCLNHFGNIVQFTWNDLPNHIDGIVLDEFIVMPDHVHGIIQITDAGMGAAREGTGLEPAPSWVALPEIIRQFKTFSAKRINIVRNSPGTPVWQRNYHDHIVQNKKSLDLIRKYIRENPLHWDKDRESHFEHEITETETGK